MTHTLSLCVLAILLVGSSYLQAVEHFLESGEIENLIPHPSVPGVSRYITPGSNPGSYDKILVGGVTFYFAEKSKAKDIDADEMISVMKTENLKILFDNYEFDCDRAERRS